ncbi:MAG: hypothetical protein IBX71_06675 [Candidatus Desulforudis sp.]|nr:hypothetical protein [Desulforudis sp.]
MFHHGGGMMVAGIELIRGKPTELETYVRELENLQAYTLDDLRTDLPRLWSVIHGLPTESKYRRTMPRAAYR